MSTTSLPAIPAPRFYSLTAEILANVNACQTLTECNTVATTYTAALASLSPVDRDTVSAAMATKRIALRAMLSDSVSDALVATRTGGTEPAASVATTITDDLSAIQANAASNAAGVRRRGRPAGSRNAPRAMTQAEISAAIATARAAGAKLAGYDGQVVAPESGKGIGVVITLGGSKAEYDAVSDRNRQALVPWSDVESIRINMGLPDGAFGRAPGLVGLLGDATEILNHGGFVARRVKSAGKYASAWKIGHFDNRIDSDSLGRKEALITLSHKGEIVCDSPDHPGAKAVLADYNRRVGATLIASDDLARRILACLRNHYSARHTDLGIYVPPFASGRAVDLVVALRPIAGRRIYASAHTDADTLGEALTDSLYSDLAKLENEISEGKVGASTLLARGERLRTEANGLGAILGTSLDAIKARLMTCDALAVAKMDERAANLELT